MPASSSAGLTGDSAISFALSHGLRLVYLGALILDPCIEEDAGELAQLILEGHDDGLTVEDPTLRAELS